jgi:hypothetical protein
MINLDKPSTYRIAQILVEITALYLSWYFYGWAVVLIATLIMLSINLEGKINRRQG